MRFDDFEARALERFRRGAAEYGDASYRLPLTRILEELEQEARDLPGWAFFAWLLDESDPGDQGQREWRFRRFLRDAWHYSPAPPDRWRSRSQLALWIAAQGLRVLRQIERARSEGVL